MSSRMHFSVASRSPHRQSVCHLIVACVPNTCDSTGTRPVQLDKHSKGEQASDIEESPVSKGLFTTPRIIDGVATQNWLVAQPGSHVLYNEMDAVNMGSARAPPTIMPQGIFRGRGGTSLGAMSTASPLHQLRRQVRGVLRNVAPATFPFSLGAHMSASMCSSTNNLPRGGLGWREGRRGCTTASVLSHMATYPRSLRQWAADASRACWEAGSGTVLARPQVTAMSPSLAHLNTSAFGGGGLGFISTALRSDAGAGLPRYDIPAFFKQQLERPGGRVRPRCAPCVCGVQVASYVDMCGLVCVGALADCVCGGGVERGGVCAVEGAEPPRVFVHVPQFHVERRVGSVWACVDTSYLQVRCVR